MDIHFLNPKAEEFYNSFNDDVFSRIVKVFDFLEFHGYNIGIPHSKSLGKGLFELRIKGATHVRFFYVFKNDCVYILHGFVKKTNEIPYHEMEYARIWQKKFL